jgi:hypothetical protein
MGNRHRRGTVLTLKSFALAIGSFLGLMGALFSMFYLTQLF